MTKRPFGDGLSEEIKNFECGDTVWAKEVSDWIKSEEAKTILKKRKTKVWLYYSDLGENVGYGCVGPCKLPPLVEGQDRVSMQILPWIGVQSSHQRKGYAKAICLDLLNEAQVHFDACKANQAPIAPLIALFVHPENKPAIELYRKLGFRRHHMTSSGFDKSQKYDGMIMFLDSR